MPCCNCFNALQVRGACNDSSECSRKSKITSPTQNKPSLCFNCINQLAGMALSFKELYHRRLRLSLCRSRLSFFTYGGSYLECPCCWIIPLTNNPFATVARMRAPAGSPPGPAGTSSPTLAFQSSAGLRTGSCVSSPRQRLARAREQGPSEVPLQTQMHQLCQSVCRMWGSPLPLPALRRARVGAQHSSADGKNGGGICMQVFKENRCRATV